MFTGLITAVGEVTAVSQTEAGRELVIAARYEGLTLGESIACSGVCLTVRDFAAGQFTVGAVVTTLDRTHIGAWRVGTKLNLERAMALGDRLGGHIVQGHVDGVGVVERAERRDDAWIVDVRVPDDIDELLVPRGSIAVDGVSLTVVELPAPNLMRLSIIEHTMRHTTLGSLRAGHRVHLEGDILAKHLKRLAAPLLKS
ncbi:riboflavin synthase [Pseudogemmatithrix spongiicola]|uniref:Riboflavin synthase n=1 Tax=Pseudogemmatithrix spongiicola TaxID=3062599 RepID=A0AA49Q4S2_9BACT|nr:riboflavin synthase [Gemmatimonadaceae bacterium 'strain 138']WKW14953.1 riboflavin synthase [Gemmatimonadaceae bacterium 'strain 318']